MEKSKKLLVSLIVLWPFCVWPLLAIFGAFRPTVGHSIAYLFFAVLIILAAKSQIITTRIALAASTLGLVALGLHLYARNLAGMRYLDCGDHCNTTGHWPLSQDELYTTHVTIILIIAWLVFSLVIFLMARSNRQITK